MAASENNSNADIDSLSEAPSDLQNHEPTPGLLLVPRENIGAGVQYVACTYFFSFLKIVIPGVREKMLQEIRRSPVVKKPTDKKYIVEKMLIIIPKTLLSPQKLTDKTNIRRTGLSIKQCFHRAGKENREYTLSIYELTDQKSGNVYYFVTDIPSCLYAIREAYEFEQNSMSEDDADMTRKKFVETVETLLRHHENQSEFANQWVLLEWPDDDKDNNRMELSEFVSQQIESNELAVSLDSAIPEGTRRFGYAHGISEYPMYSDRPRYALKNFPRGYCVIISNYEFSNPNLNRQGAEVEIEKLEELFKLLKFEVVTERNLQGQEMFSILKEYRDKDHSNKDAFVCCLLSHGSKGRILGTGLKDDSVSVVKLMELFYDDKCRELSGKPKLFFIGACQVGEPVAEDKEPSTTLQSTSAAPVPPDAGPDVSSESSNTKTDAVPEELSANVMRDLVPSAVDFIVSYACLPYTEALRDKDKGGLYVQALYKHLDRDLEIDIALRNVSQEVRDLWDEYKNAGGTARPDPFHIIMPPQKLLFLNSI